MTRFIGKTTNYSGLYRKVGSSDYKLAQTDHLTMAAGTYSHPDRGTPFDERSKEYRDRVRQELQHGRTRGDR